MSDQSTTSANTSTAKGTTTGLASISATTTAAPIIRPPAAPIQVILLPDGTPVDAETVIILTPTAQASTEERNLRSLPPQRNFDLRLGVVLPVVLENNQRLALLAQIVGQEEMDPCEKCTAEEGIFGSCVTIRAPNEQTWLSVSCANCFFKRPDLSCTLP